MSEQTSTHTQPYTVLETTSTQPTTHPPSVLSQEDFMKFSIGLRILGEKRKQRFLTYLETLTAESQARKEEKV